MLFDDDVVMEVDELRDQLTELVVLPSGSPASNTRRAIVMSSSGHPIHAEIPAPSTRATEALRAIDRGARVHGPAPEPRPILTRASAPRAAERPVSLAVFDDADPSIESNSSASASQRPGSHIVRSIELSPFAAGAGRIRSDAQLRLERVWR